jgi:hypothetical protein
MVGFPELEITIGISGFERSFEIVVASAACVLPLPERPVGIEEDLEGSGHDWRLSTHQSIVVNKNFPF